MNEQDSTHHRLRTLLERARTHLGSETADPHREHLQTAVGRAETALATQLDANHPQLAGSLRELADLLGKVGI